MKIVIASDSFKGSLSAAEVCDAVENGILKALPDAEIVKLPVSDGGEGFVETMAAAAGGTVYTEQVMDPLGREIDASYAICGESTAVIEMAAASGLPLLSQDERNPLKTSTYGTGQLIKYALEKGVNKILLGIGGSATVDGGTGMAAAFGVELIDSSGAQIDPCGGGLSSLEHIRMENRDLRFEGISVEAACDVDNPLTGENGAARIYGPQKGASPDMVEMLEKNLEHFAGVIKKDLDIDVDTIPGAGAAGGLGAGLVAFAGATLKPGIEMVLDNIGFDKAVSDADLVITGEGKIDSQTLFGKVPVGVSLRAEQASCPCIALGGMVGDDLEKIHTKNIQAYFGTIHQILPEKDVFEKSVSWIENTAEQVMRVYLLGRTYNRER